MPVIKVYSWSLRAWHWLDAVVIVALIVTFFLREFLVSHSRYLIQRLNEAGLSIADNQVRPIIGEMVDQLWTWHLYLGYALTALFIWRMILLFTVQANPLRECWRSVCAMREQFDFRNIHGTAVKAGYVVFYALQLFMIVTGLIMAFGESLKLSAPLEDAIHEGHEAVMWFFVAFVVFHVVGVFVAENKDDPGIVSAMINGRGDGGGRS